VTVPYYQDDLVTLYHGDCLEVQEWLSADVLVTDPPYGIGYASRRDGQGVLGDSSTNVRDSAVVAWQPKPGLVFGTWRAPRPSQTAAVLIWDKWGAGGFVRDHPNIPWGRTHEEIYVLGDWPRLGSGGRAREGGQPNADGSVIRVSGLNPASELRADHPTPKPVPLMERLIMRTRGVVADPFAGSGSTLVAAKAQGRKAVGVELEERYCEIAARRLSQGVLDFGAVS
jgi:DNA modification methylase